METAGLAALKDGEDSKLRVKILKDYDLVIKHGEKDRPLAVAAFKKSDEPLTTKREWGEALVKAGAAEEVKEPAKRPQNDPKVMSALRAAVGADIGRK